MPSPQMAAAANAIAAQLARHGYKKCEAPEGYAAGFGALVLFMESPEGRKTKIGMEAAVDFETGVKIDLATGKMKPVPPMPPGGCLTPRP